MWARVEKIIQLSNRSKKKNDPRQTYLCISAPKNIFLLFSTFWKWSYSQRCSRLMNVMKLDSIVSTLSNVVNVNFEMDNIDLTLFNIINFNVGIHNVGSTLIWHCPTSRRYITLTKMLKPRWKFSWVLRLYKFVKFVKLKTYIFTRIPFHYCFHKTLKRYW